MPAKIITGGSHNFTVLVSTIKREFRALRALITF
jgi:hypothetical protein